MHKPYFSDNSKTYTASHNDNGTKDTKPLVYNILKYAINTKYPRKRSAFTYCENDPPSRIDLGKNKYGGPFTIEQVEDVKTLFRTLLVITTDSECSLYLTTIEQRHTSSNIRTIFINTVSRPPKYVFSNIHPYVGLLLIPLNELVVYPLFNRCLPSFKSYGKLLFGATLQFVWCAALMMLLTYARQNYLNTESYSVNATLSCIYHEKSPSFLSNSLDYKWIVLLETILALSDLFLLIGITEFYCAQVPYSMKGLMAGIAYGLVAFYMLITQVIVQPSI